MHAEEAQPSSGSIPDQSPLPAESGPIRSHEAGVKGGSRLPLWLLTAGAGLVAGLLAALGGEAIGRAIPLSVKYPPDYAKMGGYQKEAVRSMAVGQAEQAQEQQKAAAAYGLLGLALGIPLGLIGGLVVGSLRSGYQGAAIGALLGAAAGAGASWAVVPWFFRYQTPESGGLVGLFIAHAGIFVAVGTAAGVALGVGLDNRPALVRALFGGMLGALAATFVFETACSLLFPMMRTYQPVPADALPRFLAHVCVAVGTSLTAGLAAGIPVRGTRTSSAG